MAPRILVVDCNTQSSADTEHMLAEAGYEPSIASSFEDATRQVALDCPDLLVTAVRLGRFNGLHLALRCRAEHPDLPVVVLGENGDAALAPDAARFGARFMKRPVDPKELLTVVADLLDESSADRT